MRSSHLPHIDLIQSSPLPYSDMLVKKAPEETCICIVFLALHYKDLNVSEVHHDCKVEGEKMCISGNALRKEMPPHPSKSNRRLISIIFFHGNPDLHNKVNKRRPRPRATCTTEQSFSIPKLFPSGDTNFRPTLYTNFVERVAHKASVRAAKSRRH